MLLSQTQETKGLFLLLSESQHHVFWCACVEHIHVRVVVKCVQKHAQVRRPRANPQLAVSTSILEYDQGYKTSVGLSSSMKGKLPFWLVELKKKKSKKPNHAQTATVSNAWQFRFNCTSQWPFPNIFTVNPSSFKSYTIKRRESSLIRISTWDLKVHILLKAHLTCLWSLLVSVMSFKKKLNMWVIIKQMIKSEFIGSLYFMFSMSVYIPYFLEILI